VRGLGCIAPQLWAVRAIAPVESAPKIYAYIGYRVDLVLLLLFIVVHWLTCTPFLY